MYNYNILIRISNIEKDRNWKGMKFLVSKINIITINDKKYAKVLFVVGLDYENYQPNLDLANSLNNLINSKYPGLSRGVLKKSGKNVNGIYNQDLKNNIVLIECGGYQNNIDEVMNTMIALSDIIKIYLGV